MSCMNQLYKVGTYTYFSSILSPSLPHFLFLSLSFRDFICLLPMLFPSLSSLLMPLPFPVHGGEKRSSFDVKRHGVSRLIRALTILDQESRAPAFHSGQQVPTRNREEETTELLSSSSLLTSRTLDRSPSWPLSLSLTSLRRRAPCADFIEERECGTVAS